MKKISYLDMVRKLLSEQEFLEFKQRYTVPVQKSLHPIFSRIDFDLFQNVLLSDGWELHYPLLSYKGKVYGDVLFVRKENKRSLGSHWMHQAGLFYVQEMAAGLPAQVLDVQLGDIVLDMCAAPGGKSIQLADRLKIVG